MAKSRADLLDAAMTYVAREGLADLSLRACADAIGTSHRMLTYHFGSRRGLIIAIADEASTRARALVADYAAAAPPREGASGPESLRQIMDAEVFSDRSELMGLIPLLVEVTYLIVHEPGQDHGSVSDYASIVELWRPAITAQLGLAGLPPQRAEARLRLAVAVMVGMAFDYVGTRDRAAYADMYVEWLRLARR